MRVKIDLHLHSFVSRKNGDAIKWNSLYDSISQLIKEKVQICAFSDHNIFDVDFYLEARELAQTANILLLPAIEVNVVRSDGKIANVIFVFDNNLDESFKEVSNILINNLNDFDVVMLKGSNSMSLDKIVPLIEKKKEAK